MKKEQRNVEIDDTTWERVGIMAAVLKTSKKGIVNDALRHYWMQYQAGKFEKK